MVLAKEEPEEPKNSPRKHDFVIAEPYQMEITYVVHPPALFKSAKLPGSIEVKLGPAKFSKHFETKPDETIEATYRFDSGRRRIPGPDGVPLFSTNHPLYKAGGVQSNVMAADLDILPLELAFTAFENQKRPSGEFIHVPCRKLVVSPTNRFIAHALLKSQDDPTTADRSVNPLGGAEDGVPKAFIWRYLTSPNAWFLAAEPQYTGLVWFWRKRPYTKSWTDDDTEVGVVGMRYKKSHGWNNYIGLIGNPGQ